jgi:NAD(P)H-hydrate epimerase
MEYITHKQTKIIDLNSAYLGVPTERLMDNAGRAIADVIKDRIDLRNKKVLLFCGTGNNGGDGFAAARYLADAGARVYIYLAGKTPKSREARKYYELAKKHEGIFILEDVDTEADIIVDALLGTGVKGQLREPVKSLVEKINSSNAFKVSIDVPSGLNTDTGEGFCVNADLVVALHKKKKGLEKFKTVVKDIGIPTEAESYVGPGDIIVNLGKREKESHKGDYGRVLVIGGSELYYGAPILSALGALNSGADLVFLAVPECNFHVTRTFLPDLIVRKYSGEFLNSGAVDMIIELAEECDSIVIGPGLGMREETAVAFLEVLKRLKIPVIIDADGIKALKSNTDVLKKGNTVITPHSGEFRILTGENLQGSLEKKGRVVGQWAKKLSCTILLKSPIDIISDGKTVRYNSTGNPGMTVGGTGDVLAGVLGSFIAQGLNIFDAACCAAFINGFAGDELYKTKGYAFNASDLATEIPYSLKNVFELDL